MRKFATLVVVFCLAPAGLKAASSGPGPDPPIRQWSAPRDWGQTSRPGIVAEGILVLREDSEGSVDLPRDLEAASGALAFVAVTPCRVADTRNAGLPAGYGPPFMVGGVPRDFTVWGRCGIPATAQAVSFNFTVVNPVGPGFLLVFPQGGVQPVVSTLNYAAAQTVANAAAVPLGATGAITAIPGVSGFDLIIDVNGYYAPAGSACSATGATYAQTFGGLEFRPGHSGLEYAPVGASIYATAIPSGGQSLRLPVHLPDGAFVTGITFYVVDNDAGNDMTLQLYATSPESYNQTGIAGVTTAALPVSASVQAVTMTGSPIVTINNSIHSYLLRYGPVITGSNHLLVGVRITYKC
jgi:hypothetical protein